MGQVLRLFFYKKKLDSLTIRLCATDVAKAVIDVWSLAEIPVRRLDHVIEKIEKLHNEWKYLQKSSKKKTQIRKRKEVYFRQKLDKLFDIARHDALQSLPNIKKNFLEGQREKSRRGFLPASDSEKNSAPDPSVEPSNEQLHYRRSSDEQPSHEKIPHENTIDVDATGEFDVYF